MSRCAVMCPGQLCIVGLPHVSIACANIDPTLLVLFQHVARCRSHNALMTTAMTMRIIMPQCGIAGVQDVNMFSSETLCECMIECCARKQITSKNVSFVLKAVWALLPIKT